MYLRETQTYKKSYFAWTSTTIETYTTATVPLFDCPNGVNT